MGIFDIFKKEKLEVLEVEKIKGGVADELIDHVLGLVENKESINELIKEINKARKLPVEKRENSYLPVYLSLERVILGKKSASTKEYFSRKTLRKQKEFTQEGLRKAIREKFEINKLEDNFRVLFIEEPQQNLILYELICQEFINLIPNNIYKKILDAILKETNKNFLKGIKIKDKALDFSAVNKKIDEDSVATDEIKKHFKSMFSAIYKKIAESKGNDSADEIIANVHNFAEAYGYPLNSEALQILPKVTTKEAEAAAAHAVVDYISGLALREDLIMPQLEKIRDAETLQPEEKENAYFDAYLELEKFMTEHKPPAVKKEFTREELRKDVREEIDIQNLGHKFKLFFLEKDEQVIELFIVFYELFLKHIVSFWKLTDLQKFVRENLKDKSLDKLGVVIDKEGNFFDVAETKTSDLPKNQLSSVIRDLSKFFVVWYKKAKEVTGEKKAEKAISDAYRLMKEQYGQLTIFTDFVRQLPEGILDYERRILLSPKAAEEVLKYMTEILEKDGMEEHLKALEEAKKLPLEEQSEAFFNIYLNLQHYIVEQRLSFKGKEMSLSELKERIRKYVNVKDLEEKFQLLFLAQDEVLVELVSDLIKECVANFIDKKALVEAVRELIKKNRFLKDVEIDEEGSIDFEPFFDKLKKVKTAKVKVLNSTLSMVVLAIYEKAKGILGESQAKKLFEIAHSNLQKKYGANLLPVLKVIPKGVLEAEKFELLGKEEIEKTAKEMVKIDTLKGEFMNIAAHELKTPLVPIISYLEMLLNDKRLTRDQKEKIKICLSSAKREADLVSDILDISKLEAGTLKLEVDIVDMVELTREATEGLAPSVKQKNLTFKVDIPSRLPLVKGDKRRLMQVITNLINNATKFTEKGGITVKAQKREKDVLVSVSDTGIGISKENQHKLFTKFFQVDTSARRKQGGTGLGLAICKGIVEQHKGKMWVESQVGKGATFLFTVPAVNE